MSRIPTPDRGQPFDVSYVYQIVEAVNDLSEKSSTSVYKYTSVDTVSGPKSFVTSETKMVGGELEVYKTLSTVTAGSSETKSYQFKGEFKYPPIVTASPVLIDGVTAGAGVSVIVKNVTTSKVDFLVNFEVGGQIAVKINFIAIGVPN